MLITIMIKLIIRYAYEKAKSFCLLYELLKISPGIIKQYLKLHIFL